MIQTVAYNNFSSLPADILINPELLLKEIEIFCINNGNLNYPIKDGESSLIPAEEWMREKFQDIAIMNHLFNIHALTSPAKWVWDAENRTISSNILYNNRWYKKNHQFYHETLAKGIDILLNEITQSHIEPLYFLEYDSEQQPEKTNKLHPIYYLAQQLCEAKVYSAIFNQRPDYIELWKNAPLMMHGIPHFVKEMGITHSKEGINYSSFNAPDIGLVFYQHNIARDFFLEDTNKLFLNKLIRHAIINNNLDFLQKFIKDWDLSQIEKECSIDECFLHYAKTKEMAQFLLENNAFVAGYYSNLNNISYVFGSRIISNSTVFETIIDFNPIYKDLIFNEPSMFFSEYFTTSQQPIMTLLMDKYQFPIEQFDMLAIGHSIYGEDGIAWALNLGANQKKCSTYIEQCIYKKAEGLAELKRLHKKGIFNPFQPDSLSVFLRKHNLPKIFSTWLEKTTQEELTQYTSEGIPVWWNCIEQNSFLIKKIDNYNQLALDNTSWLMHLIQHCNNYNNDPIKFIHLACKKLQKQFDNFLEPGQCNQEGNNIFHILFNNHPFSMNGDLLSKIFEVTDINFNTYFTMLNNEHISPIEMLIHSGNPNLVNNFLFLIVNTLQNNLDYDFKLSDNTSLIDNLQKLFSSNEENLKNLNTYYNNYYLHKTLPIKKSVTSHKIKI